MKRGCFIFLFLLVTVLLLYSEPSNNLVRLGCGTGGGGGQTQTQTPTENCELIDNPEALSSLANSEVPSGYKYPTGEPTGWKFDLSDDRTTGRLRLLTYSLTHFGVREDSLIFTQLETNNDNCKFFYLPYFRMETTIPYQVANAGREGNTCLYNCNEITNDVYALFGIDLSSARAIPKFLSKNINLQTGTGEEVFVKYEELKSNSDCLTDYETKGEFVDNSGNTIKHCVKTVDEFVAGGEYVINSYLEVFDGVQRCRSGGDGLVWFNDKENNIVYLCVEISIADEEEVVNGVVISESFCPSGFVESSDSVELEDKTIVHCIQNTVQQSPETDCTFLDFPVDICPDFNSGTVSGGECPTTETCDVTVPEVELSFYAAELETCGGLLYLKPTNNGLPTADLEEVYTWEEEFLEECLEKYEEEELEIVCGNGVVDEGEECDDGNEINTDSCINCRNARCGDGFVKQGTEECDDGNTVSGDGCDGGCKEECPKKCYSWDRSNFVCCQLNDVCGKSDDGKGYAPSMAWCVPNNPSSVSCPSGTTRCSRGQSGDSVACCPSGWSCKTYNGAAWCSANSASSCTPPKTKFCSKNNGGGDKDSTCCLPGQSCIEYSGYSWCSVSESACKSKGAGYTPCGFYCCTPQQVCRGNGWAPNSCSMKGNSNCPAGKEKCTGTANDYPIVVCCNTGMCVPALNGPPLCKDHVYWP